MGTGYTTLRASHRGAEQAETGSDNNARPLKNANACKDAGRRIRGDVAFARIFEIRSVKG